MRTAVVTGAARGIGLGIAQRLAQDGFSVVLNDLNEEALMDASKNLRSLGCKVEVFPGDVTEVSTNEALIDFAIERFGSLEVMVTNAGIVQIASLDDMTPGQLERIFAVNVFATAYGIRAAARAMRKVKSGKIITCASVAGHSGSALMAAYCASKAAVISLTQSAARELAPDGITVNAYCPGAVATEMWTELSRELRNYGEGEASTADEFVASIPLGRMQTPEDVAGVVSFLAGPDSDYMTGQSVIVDGGIYMQ